MRIAAAFLALATAGATLVSTPALAGDTHRVAVEYRDLNLDTDQGRNALKGRINAAARRICGPASGPSPVDEFALYNCRANAAEQANTQVLSSLGSGRVQAAR